MINISSSEAPIIEPPPLKILTVDELIQRISSYDPDVEKDADKIRLAYKLAEESHSNQKRASGDPYFCHPVAVAEILTTFKLDPSSIITALLHDVIEDTNVTYNDVKKQFGEEIAKLVEGVTKLSQIEIQRIETAQAENFRKLVLAMSQDIRVLLVKLADRLHNMRTLGAIKNEKRRLLKAQETMEIYAPLAERIGIQKLRDELFDLSFFYLNHDAYDSIKKRMDRVINRDEDGVDGIKHELKQLLADNGIQCEVSGRSKMIHSIWRKMQSKNIPFEQLADIFAFRIIVDSVGLCYQALGILHSAYPVIPGRFKDYISTPKNNNYQSLHTCLIGPRRHRIEIQIRTRDMHEICEMGVAAHWKYKQNKFKQDGTEFKWLRELLEVLANSESPNEFLEHTKLNIYDDEVFCFTPNGDLISLPMGATPVDFAYAIHSQVGNKCTGAKINGKIMPLRVELKNGDTVEILTSPKQEPSPAWERFVVTAKAKSHIRRAIAEQQQEQYLHIGRVMLQKLFKQENLPYNEKKLDAHIEDFYCDSLEELLQKVGRGSVQARDIIRVMFPHKHEEVTPTIFEDYSSSPVRHEGESSSVDLPIQGLMNGIAVQFAKCCHPLPGEPIVGLITTGKGVKIHTRDCENLQRYINIPERLIENLTWDIQKDAKKENFIGRLRVVIGNQTGALAAIATCISKNNTDITNLRFMTRQQDYFEVLIDVEVKDVRHLQHIMADLRSLNMVNEVTRV